MYNSGVTLNNLDKGRGETVIHFGDGFHFCQDNMKKKYIFWRCVSTRFVQGYSPGTLILWLLYLVRVLRLVKQYKKAR